MKNYVGIDIGGMTIKGMIVSEEGAILASDSICTGSEKGGLVMCDNIIELTNRMYKEAGVQKKDTVGVGVGCPGVIDSENGEVVFAGNLNLKNFPLALILGKELGLPIKITNDANAAALGEAKFGAGKDYHDSVMVTLGTGVGGGIVIDGKLFEGNKSAGAEIGHMVIERFGERCTCGRRGCFEAYASASALMKHTRLAMENNPGSDMWKTYNLDTVTGKTPFDYCEHDIAAREVVDWYLRYLACGLTNIANIFRPEIIMIGGGVSEQGEKLTKPLQQLVNQELLGGCEYAPVKIVKATLGSKAGALGAAALVM